MLSLPSYDVEGSGWINNISIGPWWEIKVGHIICHSFYQKIESISFVWNLGWPVTVLTNKAKGKGRSEVSRSQAQHMEDWGFCLVSGSSESPNYPAGDSMWQSTAWRRRWAQLSKSELPAVPSKAQA